MINGGVKGRNSLGEAAVWKRGGGGSGREGSGEKGEKSVAICTRIALNGAFFRHFRQDFFAYFSW